MNLLNSSSSWQENDDGGGGGTAWPRPLGPSIGPTGSGSGVWKGRDRVSSFLSQPEDCGCVILDLKEDISHQHELVRNSVWKKRDEMGM